MADDESEMEIEIDDDVLEEEDDDDDDDGGGGSSSEGEADEDEEDEEAARVLSFVADMPEAERERLGEIVWAQSPGFKHWPAFIYHPSDVNDELRARLYKGKGNEGPKTHHIVFYYNFGVSAFAGVPFKSILPWTPENTAALTKVVKQYKAKLPGAIEAAEADLARPKDERNPGPPDQKAIRKQEREARRAEREAAKRERQEQRRAERAAAKREQRAERNRAGKKKRKQKGGGGAAAKKAKTDFAKESEGERFARLAKNLELLLEDGSENLNVAKICSTLDKLAAMRATIQQLTETGIGQVVKGLRRHDNAEIQAKAKHAFAVWKQNLAAASAATAAPAAEETGRKEVEEAEQPHAKQEEAPKAAAAPEEGKVTGKEEGEEEAAAVPATKEPSTKPPESSGEAPRAATSTSASSSTSGGGGGEANLLEEKGAAAAEEGENEEGGAEGEAAREASATSQDGVGSPGLADMDETKKRQRARGLLKQVLAEGGGAEEEAALVAVAEQAEGLLFAHRKGRADDKYLSCLRSLCSSLKGNHGGLRARLLGGEVEAGLAEFLNKA